MVKEKGLDKDIHRQEYRDLNRRIQKQIRQDKTEFIQQKCAEVERNSVTNNTKDMYRNIKQLTNKPTHRLNVLKDDDGNILTEGEEIKARWKQYCENL